MLLKGQLSFASIFDQIFAQPLVVYLCINRNAIAPLNFIYLVGFDLGLVQILEVIARIKKLTDKITAFFLFLLGQQRFFDRTARNAPQHDGSDRVFFGQAKRLVAGAVVGIHANTLHARIACARMHTMFVVVFGLELTVDSFGEGRFCRCRAVHQQKGKGCQEY